MKQEKTKAGRVEEILEAVMRVLEAENTTESTSTVKEKDDIGKTQPVGDYPDSPLRYKGAGR